MTGDECPSDNMTVWRDDHVMSWLVAFSSMSAVWQIDWYPTA